MPSWLKPSHQRRTTSRFSPDIGFSIAPTGSPSRDTARAMSEESVETVRSIYEAFNRRDWDEAFRHQHPDVEMTTPPGINAGTFRGREEIQRFWEEILSAFESTFAEPEQLVASGDQ